MYECIGIGFCWGGVHQSHNNCSSISLKSFFPCCYFHFISLLTVSCRMWIHGKCDKWIAQAGRPDICRSQRLNEAKKLERKCIILSAFINNAFRHHRKKTKTPQKSNPNKTDKNKRKYW